MAECSVDGCNRPVRCRGWCNSHYLRWRRCGDTLPDSPVQVKSFDAHPCDVEGCDKRATRRGWCSTHYARWRVHGDVHTVLVDTHPAHPKVRLRKPRGVGDATYRAVHKRLARGYGKASARDCGDCGEQAAHWSYNGGDPNEKRSPAGRLYSTDLTRYQPRCVRCHAHFDNHCGQAHYGAKLADTQVEELRQAYADGESTVALAARFKISQSQAWRIVNGQSRAAVSNV